MTRVASFPIHPFHRGLVAGPQSNLTIAAAEHGEAGTEASGPEDGYGNTHLAKRTIRSRLRIDDN